MKTIHFIPRILTGLMIAITSCNAQSEETLTNGHDRMPAVAGSFYPSSKIELTEMLAESFSNTSRIADAQPLAIIVPHAGYIFSGKVAASGYRQIDRNSKFDHVFLIGSSHTMYFNGASVYDQGDFITPYGKVKVDTLAQWLTQHYKIFSSDPKPHLKEHSLEVQLPFLQYWLNKEFTIVPIIIGGESKETCKKVAGALNSFFNRKNLFIISSDFSHYPEYEQAEQCDAALANSIVTNSAEEFLKVKRNIENKNIRNLATAMCGWTSAYSLLTITQDRTDISYRKIMYQNSGDTRYGDKDRVVGYYAMGAYQEEQKMNESFFKLSDDDKMALLEIARNTVNHYISDGHIEEIQEEKLPPSLKIPAGAFVTLLQNENLRGCIGHFEADNPLYFIVQKMAIAAATKDPRFYPVKKQEISGLEIEISVLTPMRKIESIDEIEMGKHGIYIKDGHKGGTFLPQVASKTGWTKEEFLGHCAQDKVGIGWDGWKTADIYVYESLVFSEHEFNY